VTTLAFAPQGVFFDLDGTLLDSALDLYGALGDLCAREGRDVPDYDVVRPVVSRGSRAIIATAWPHATPDEIQLLAPRYLALYEANIARHTVPFEGIEGLLAALEAAHVAWGIVTNKPGFLTDALLPLAVPQWKPAAVVSGDTLAVKKPDPAPVLHACRTAGCDPVRSVFVGDDQRDILAGRAAGAFTIAVRWGYLDGGDPDQWGADAVVSTAGELLDVLGLRAVPA